MIEESTTLLGMVCLFHIAKQSPMPVLGPLLCYACEQVNISIRFLYIRI